MCESLEYVGKKEHVEQMIEMMPIAQCHHAALRPQLLCTLVLLIIEIFADEPIVEGRLGRQLSLVHLRLVCHVLIRIAALLEVGVVVVAEMSDGVREHIDARLSQRFHKIVKRGGEKLTRVQEDVTDLQQHVMLTINPLLGRFIFRC